MMAWSLKSDAKANLYLLSILSSGNSKKVKSRYSSFHTWHVWFPDQTSWEAAPIKDENGLHTEVSQHIDSMHAVVYIPRTSHTIHRPSNSAHFHIYQALRNSYTDLENLIVSTCQTSESYYSMQTLPQLSGATNVSYTLTICNNVRSPWRELIILTCHSAVPDKCPYCS